MRKSIMRRRFGGVLLAFAIGGLGLTGCGDDDETVSSPSGSAPAEDTASAGDGAGGEAITVTATDYAFAGVPKTLEGGVITVEFRNEGDKPHEMGLMQVSEQLSAEEFGSAIKPIFEGAKFPKEFLGHTGITEVEPGESTTSTFTLAEGDYALYCSITDEEGDNAEGAEGEAGGEEESAPPHFELGMFQPVTVEGDSGGELPDGPSIVATDYSFASDGLEAGKQEITFRNDSAEQFHHVVVFEWPEGTDEGAAAAAWKTVSQLEEGTPPPEGTPEPEDVAGSQVFGPGSGGTFAAELSSGRTYTFVCFIQDKEGGPPHAFAHDMVNHLTLD